MTRKIVLVPLVLIAALILGCSSSSDPGTGDPASEYNWESPGDAIGSFTEIWNHMDFAEYRDFALYDGEELATDGAAYSAFKFYFVDDTGEYGPFWGCEEEKEHTEALFSGNPSQDATTPGVESVALNFVPAGAWSDPDNPLEVEGDEYPDGTQYRTYQTDLTVNLKGTIEGTEVNVLLVRDTVRFYVIPVGDPENPEYRLWKWMDLTQGFRTQSSDWSTLKALY